MKNNIPKVIIAILNPFPAAPRMASFGTSQSSKIRLQVDEARIPNLSSFFPKLKPKQEIVFVSNIIFWLYKTGLVTHPWLVLGKGMHWFPCAFCFCPLLQIKQHPQIHNHLLSMTLCHWVSNSYQHQRLWLRLHPHHCHFLNKITHNCSDHGVMIT